MTEDDIGYRQPPKSSRFPKGKSGNPNGRPKGRHLELPYQAVLGQDVEVNISGTTVAMSAEEAFLKRMQELAVSGKVDVAVLLETALDGENHRSNSAQSEIETVELTVVPIPNGSVAHHLQTLGALKKLFRLQSTCEFKIENWAIQAALDRLGDSVLSLEEQKIVFEATRNPNKISWPEWWEFSPETLE